MVMVVLLSVYLFDDLVWVGGGTVSVDEVEAMQYVARIFKHESHLLCLRTDESLRDGISAIQSLLPRIVLSIL